MVRSARFAHRVIVKPTFMMDNFIPPKAAFMFPAISRGAIETALSTETRMDPIAAADAGRFAAVAFAEPGRFDGVDLTAETLTMGEVAATIAVVTGRAVVVRAERGRGARSRPV